MLTNVGNKPDRKALSNNHIKKKGLLLEIYNSRYLLFLLLPCVVYYILFQYLPMWGVLLAFKNYKPFMGFFASEWVGFKYFNMFLSSPEMFTIIKNTFLIGIYTIILGFPTPLIFALVLNEVKNQKAKKLIQTVSYMPHFLSVVVIVGMIQLLLSPRGMVNQVILAMGFDPIVFLQKSSYFRSIYVISGIWQDMGWGAIIYLAAISNIDVQLYEAAIIDGANKFKQIVYVTLPCIAPTIITLLLLRMGRVINVGFEKVFLLQNPTIYNVSEVISTYVYSQGLALGNFSYGTAVGLFNSAINLCFLVISNWLAKRYSETSLW